MPTRPTTLALSDLLDASQLLADQHGLTVMLEAIERMREATERTQKTISDSRQLMLRADDLIERSRRLFA
jgi:hypothetical protein